MQSDNPPSLAALGPISTTHLTSQKLDSSPPDSSSPTPSPPNFSAFFRLFSLLTLLKRPPTPWSPRVNTETRPTAAASPDRPARQAVAPLGKDRGVGGAHRGAVGRAVDRELRGTQRPAQQVLQRGRVGSERWEGMEEWRNGKWRWGECALRRMKS